MHRPNLGAGFAFTFECTCMVSGNNSGTVTIPRHQPFHHAMCEGKDVDQIVIVAAIQ